MSVDASPLAHAHHHRLGAFVPDEQVGDWRRKLYGLAAGQGGPARAGRLHARSRRFEGLI